MTNLQIIESIQESQKIINTAKLNSIQATGSAFHNPIFDKLNNAQKYLSKQIAEALSL